VLVVKIIKNLLKILKNLPYLKDVPIVTVRGVVCGGRVYGVNATFNNISVISFQSVFNGGGNRSTQRKPLTCRKSLTNFIT
jgi:hypothetical protein